MSESASSMKPRPPFTVFIQPPDLGAFWRRPGNMANRQNGMARASEKPNMPIAGPKRSPVLTASTRSVPIIGPVQENETSTRVNAMKKILRRPVVLSTVESILLLHDEGSVISNAPKNEIANITRRRKKIMLQMALVAMAFSALAPNMAVMISPIATYITIMESP